VQQTLELVAGRAAAAGVAIAFDQPSRSVRMAIDPGQFRQVVLNLVLNALDAVKAGGQVEVHLGQERDGELKLRVSDNGRGLPLELGGRIFDPFTTTKEGGLGLGLSICKRIAEAHGGTIAGANGPEGGAVFIVRLPGTGQ
jgi:signal transduction histidine kinase